ncbi:glutamine-rich protein 2 isoform X3 [Anabas testudineus]|uniref:glutamine-rich protein 2 isoform X3 n=1 Tax=Anabas testudineus TaxID=64144 RepID=UPI000E45990B|nr:glutamine-rich protein 2 isoform X3 [Anabas testudineus]
MSEDSISLYDLLNLAIGTPQQGAVNFSALHSLLVAVLRQLDIREAKTRWRDSSPGDRQLTYLVDVTGLKQYQHPEEKQLQTHGDLEQDGQPGTELQKRVPSSSSPTPTSGAAEDAQRRLLSRIQACEDGVSKVTKLIQELRNQKDNLKDEIKDHEKKLVGAQQDTFTVVEKCCHRVDALEETVTSLKDSFQKYPVPEQLSQYVTWDTMQSALLSKTENLQKELVNSRAAGSVRPVRPTHTPLSSSFTAANISYTSTPSSPSPVDDAVRTASPTPPVISAEISTVQQATDVQPTEPSSVLSPQQTHLETDLMTAGIPLSRATSGSERYSETMETLRNIGKLKENFDKMEARLAALEEGKVDKVELTNLSELITNTGSQDVSDNLMDQLKQQRDLIDSLSSDWEKLNSLLDMFMNPTNQEGETISEGATESVDSGEFHELRRQIFYLRRSVQKLEEDMKQLKAKQALSDERMTDQNLQDQLDDLRGMLEEMMLSLTSELSSNLEDEDEQDESNSEALDQNKERSVFTSRTVNIGRKLSRLFQYYEQLQDTVNNLLQQQTGGRAGPLKIRENVELVNDVQKAILQLQAECEKLHETTRCLHEDNRQKQSHIEELYKTTEELDEKKADKQMVESEIKADKSVLESKVSRLQFDSATEQLNTMFHELLNKVMGQEQDWHKVIDKLSTEMECKLNRIELDSVKKQLEDRWKSIHERLQAQGAPEHEDAAGIRKQLVDRFHCLSCDRPVVKHTPGPHLVTLPSTPGFPSHKSIRPFTVYALEQFRQHYRSERIAELTDYSHLAVSRSCGGSHTVTSSSQRRTGLQYMKHHSQPEVDSVIQSEEVDIVGLDGHIYKGRLNPAATRNSETKLPTISAKDGMCKTKDKPRGSPSHKPAVSPEVGFITHQPQSARSAQCSRSASSLSGRDWPVSALGCASQSSISQTSAAGESNSEPLDNQQEASKTWVLHHEGKRVTTTSRSAHPVHRNTRLRTGRAR